MELTREFKKLYLEFFSRAAIVVFSIGIAAPFVAGKLTFSLAGWAFGLILVCLIVSSFVALSLKEKEGE